ncbi:MAG TPA: hypothetical protein VFN74_05190 [Chloroflexota bacterium]|nr:hypothetical protein [Chloroflexota bacterium]
MRGRNDPSFFKSPAPPPGHAPVAPFSSSFLADRLKADIASLDDLEHAWLPLAMRGNARAADRVLAIQRQRASLVQLALQAAAQAEQHEAALKMATGEHKIVIEYVDDWRNAGRENLPKIESRRVSSDASSKVSPEQGGT